MELHHLAGEVLDGADLVEQLAQTVVDEPAERLQLEFDQIGDRQDFGDPRIPLALRSDDSVAPGGFSDRQHQALLARETKDRSVRRAGAHHGQGKEQGKPRSPNGHSKPRAAACQTYRPTPKRTCRKRWMAACRHAPSAVGAHSSGCRQVAPLRRSAEARKSWCSQARCGGAWVPLKMGGPAMSATGQATLATGSGRPVRACGLGPGRPVRACGPGPGRPVGACGHLWPGRAVGACGLGPGRAVGACGLGPGRPVRASGHLCAEST